MVRFSSISFKLSGAFAVALALVLVTGAVGLMQLREVNDMTHRIRDAWLPRFDAIANLTRFASTHDLQAARRTENLGFRELAAISRAIDGAGDAFDEELAQLDATVMSPEESDLVAKLTEAWAGYETSFQSVLSRLNSGEATEAHTQFRTETRGHFDTVMASLAGLQKLADGGLSQAEAEANAVYERAVVLVVIALVGSLVTAIVTVAWIHFGVSRPLLRVSEAMRRLTRGDQSVTIDQNGHGIDEIDTLLAAAAGYRDQTVEVRRLAVVAETEKQRLEAAIANMPIGLCLFDADHRLIVCNRAYQEIYHLRSELTRPGTHIDEIVQERIRQGTYNGSDPSAHSAEVRSNVMSDKVLSAIWELPDGRFISCRFQPLAVGWLATHEDITERRRSEARIAHMARHDALTDLPNRILFGERVDDALARLERGEQVAVLTLDLDRFKNVNDTLGHPIGDRLLRQVADRLRNSVRDGDTVARFGGDEFAVIQVADDQPAAARALAQRLVDTMSETFVIEDHQISIGASVGVVLAPGDGTVAETLLKNADMALYRSKADGRGVYRFFEADMDARMQARRRLELDLRRALVEKEFCLYYQPLVDTKRNQVIGFEALMRWQHPERGLVSPAEFIPVAEETGLIVPLGEWALQQACRDAATWPRDIHVAVNLSPVQFRSRSLAETVMGALALSGLSPKRLELEITEGVLLANNDDTMGTLHRLRALGVRIAMDDFGTGYSSLSYLQSFPFDKIKIDASFVRRMASDESSMAIVRAVTGLGASLGMRTTAEGVETAEELDWVRKEGVSEVQGYLFSRPRPAEEVAGLIESLSREQKDSAAA